MSTTDERLIEIARRKERLVARTEFQRGAIASSFGELRGAAAVADRGIALFRFVQTHPMLVGAGVAALMVLRGRGVLSVASRGLAVWRLWKSVSSL